MTDSSQFTYPIAAWFWTYWMHSTAFLASCAVLIHYINPKSYALKAWLWKSAATVPVFTSIASLALSTQSMQFGFVIENTLAIEELASRRSESPNSITSRVDDTRELAENSIEGRSAEAGGSPSVESMLTNEQDERPNGALNASSGSSVDGMTWNRRLRFSAPPAWAVFFLLLGSFIWCLIKVLRFHFAYRRFLSSVVESNSGKLHDELNRFLKSAGILWQVRLLISDRATQPFAMGILCWTIVVPRDIESVLDRKQLRAMFAHEVGHLLRRDAVWIAIGGFLCSFLAFQPLNFVARRHWLDASEFLADDWAVQHGVAPIRLASCLAQVAEWQASGMPKAVMSFANSSANTLTRRVEHLLNERSRDTWKAPAQLSANVALSLVGLIVVFFGPNVDSARALVPDLNANGERSQLSTQLQGIANELHSVMANLNLIETKSGSLGQLDGLKERIEQLKQRSVVLVERAEGLSELCKKDLP